MLISSAIIIVVLGTLVFIAQSSLTNAAYMQERAQAVSLAAEAIETVRQNRDSNYIDGVPGTKWDTVGSSSTAPISSYFSSTFYIPYDLVTGRLRLNTTSTYKTIKIDGVNFTRLINFSDIATLGSGELLTKPVDYSNNGQNGFLVTVKITWSGSGGKSGNVEVEELIANSRFVY